MGTVYLAFFAFCPLEYVIWMSWCGCWLQPTEYRIQNYIRDKWTVDKILLDPQGFRRPPVLLIFTQTLRVFLNSLFESYSFTQTACLDVLTRLTRLTHVNTLQHDGTITWGKKLRQDNTIKWTNTTTQANTYIVSITPNWKHHNMG